MNRQGHNKAGKNEPEPVKRTDLAHTIAHAAGLTHDCTVKDPKDTKDTKQTNQPDTKKPDVKFGKEKESAKPEEKKEPAPKPEEEALKSLKKILEDNELRKLVQAILEETEDERKKALQQQHDWA